MSGQAMVEPAAPPPAAPSTLRATAPPYIPLSTRSSPDAAEQQQDLLQALGSTTLLELPSEVIAIVLSKLGNWQDATSTSLCCTTLMREMAKAPMNLSFNSSKAAMMTSTQAGAYVSSIVKYAPSVTSLDLSNLHIDNQHVTDMCRSLSHLRLLNLSGCKKLTSILCEVLVQEAGAAKTTEAKFGAQLQGLDLQRCFQLNAACLSTILRACSETLRLRFLAMSHLDFDQLELNSERLDAPGDVSHANADSSQVPAPPPLSRHADSSLRMLALHNCTRLSTAALFSLASSCPQLQLLLLGGSSFTQHQGQLDACVADIDDHLRLLISPPMGTWPLVCTVRAAVETTPAILASQASSSKLQHMILTAVIIASAALALPELQAIELSFVPPPVVAAVSHALAQACVSLGRRPPAVWDLTQAAGVHSALQMLRLSQEVEVAGKVSASGLPAQLLSAALKCAVNCSSSTRTTPLHSAAFTGACIVAERLLELGAVVAARDVAGATALFLAAEAGQAAAVHKLLAAGGDPSLSNAAGESPLYIASLKGHLEVVRVLVEGCVQRRISWHKLRYGDGWTPLMAAALANRYHVAQCLLLAVGAEAALDLANAANRYGQSALHIAARKGSPQMLQLLLCVGGASALTMADASGETPWDVAVKHSHSAAVAEFRRVCAHP